MAKQYQITDEDVEVIRVYRTKTGRMVVQQAYDSFTPFEAPGLLAEVALVIAKSVLDSVDTPNKARPNVAGYQLLNEAANFIVEENTDPEAFVDILGAAEFLGDDFDDDTGMGHPGALMLPEEVYNPGADAIQTLSIWMIPKIEECDGCGGSHPEELLINQNITRYTPEQWGKVISVLTMQLAEAYEARAENPVPLEAARDRITASYTEGFIRFNHADPGARH